MKILHEDASSESLRLAFVLIFSIWLIKILFVQIPDISFLPQSLYEPVGFIKLFPYRLRQILLTFNFLQTVKGLLLGMSLYFIVIDFKSLLPGHTETVSPKAGMRTLVGLAFCFLVTVYEGILRGFAGHISHEDIFFTYATYLLALFQLANYLSWKSGDLKNREKPNLSGLPLTAIIFFLCFHYFMVAIYRLTHGGLEVFHSGSLTYWAIRDNVDVLNPEWGWGFLILNPWVERIFNMGYPVITITEFFGPLCLISKRCRNIFVAIMLPFHISTWFFLDVVFKELIIIYILFFDLSNIKQWILRRCGFQASPSSS